MHHNSSRWLRAPDLLQLPLKVSAPLCLLDFLMTLVSSCAYTAGYPDKLCALLTTVHRALH